MAANQKHWPCNRLGAAISCDKPLRDKPLEDCSTLHRGPRQAFVTEGPRQRFGTERGGAPRQHGF